MMMMMMSNRDYALDEINRRIDLAYTRCSLAADSSEWAKNYWTIVLNTLLRRIQNDDY